MTPLPAPHPMALLAFAAGLAAQSALGQTADQGSLEIRIRGGEAGTEHFSVVTSSSNLRIVSRTVFSGTQPPLELSASVERSSGGELVYQSDRTGSAPAGYYAVMARGRLTVRRVERGAEQAMESRGSPDIVLLTDSLVAPLLQILPLLGNEPRALLAVFPASNRRAKFSARRILRADGTAVVAMSGELEGELVFNADGALLHASVLGLALEAIRKRD